MPGTNRDLDVVPQGLRQSSSLAWLMSSSLPWVSRQSFGCEIGMRAGGLALGQPHLGDRLLDANGELRLDGIACIEPSSSSTLLPAGVTWASIVTSSPAPGAAGKARG